MTSAFPERSYNGTLSRNSTDIDASNNVLDSNTESQQQTTRQVSEMYLDMADGTREPFESNQQEGLYLMPHQVINGERDRPATATSADTYQKAQTMFTDFDGAHYASTVQGDDEDGLQNRSSSAMLMSPPPLDNRIPPPAPGMVFYPAPVPRTLMLPQRLSRAMPAAEQAKRRSHMLAGLSSDARKSAFWLNKHSHQSTNALAEAEDDAQRLKQRMSSLPPQLRASMYFETPSQVQEVEIKDTSAVATLEELLDASTVAPVSAFTDHPFAGKAGGNIYKSEHTHARKASKDTPPRKTKRRGSMLGLRHLSMSSSNVLNDVPKPKKHGRAFSLGSRLDHDTMSTTGEVGARPGTASDVSAPLPSFKVDAVDVEHGELSSEEDPDFDMPSEDDDELARVGPPTTLLAELQYRKQVQKQRNKTALSAFPNGMHSTLLEMDAVAQIQKKKRQNARVTLAWEDPDRSRIGQVAADDDDLPLGMIFAQGKNPKVDADWDQPMGLIQLRELEDNEPLAARKARLRGSEMFVNRPAGHVRSLSGTPMLQVNGDILSTDEAPEETLAQRSKRLKNRSPTGSNDGSRPISQALSEQVLAQQENAPAQQMMISSEENDEETLGQRRARLQRESQRRSQMDLTFDGQTPEMATPQSSRPALRASTSMADLLHNVPVGATRRVSEKNLLSSLPQHSLLKQSEDKRAAHAEMMTDIRNAHRVPSGHFSGRPLLDMSSVDHNKHSIPNNGYRGGMYNNGFGGVGAAPPSMNQSMIDLRQSMAIIAQQNQLALQMMASQGPMVDAAGLTDPHVSMQMPMMMQPHMPMHSQISPQMAMPPIMHMNPYGQMPMHPSYHAANMAAGSTPTLMTTGPMSMAGQAAHQQNMSATGVPMPLAQDDAFVDVNTQARIDAWRQDVRM